MDDLTETFSSVWKSNDLMLLEKMMDFKTTRIKLARDLQTV